MTSIDDGRTTRGGRPLRLWAVVGSILLLAATATPVLAMWVRMTDAELIQKSAWIVVGEWIGQGPVRTADGAAATELGVIAVHEVLRGPPATTVAFVALPGPDRPISSSDLRFKRGDRGVWFLRARVADDGGGPFVVDHPQRFLRDVPGNAAALASVRQMLRR